MAFQNDVVGGITLVRPAIQSPNYIAGTSGWTINIDGSAEFNNITTRGPVIVTDPVTGNVVASIGAAGDVSGRFGTFTDVILTGGTNQPVSLYALVANAPRGNVASFFAGGALASPGNGTFVDIAYINFVDQGRYYKIYCENLVANHTAGLSVNKRLYMELVGTAGFIGTQIWAFDILQQASVSFNWYFYTGITTPRSQTVVIRAESVDAGAGMSFQPPLFCAVDDYGIGNLGFADGGLGSPAGTVPHLVNFPALATAQYSKTGVLNPYSNDNPIYGAFDVGSFPTNNMSGMWTFNGAAIRTALSGASNVTAFLFMYAKSGRKSYAGLNISLSSSTTLFSSYAPTRGTYDFTFSHYALPGWMQIDLTTAPQGNPNSVGTTMLAQILAGANSFLIISSAFLDDGTVFAGFGEAARPYIQLQYTK